MAIACIGNFQTIIVVELSTPPEHAQAQSITRIASHAMRICRKEPVHVLVVCIGPTRNCCVTFIAMHLFCWVPTKQQEFHWALTLCREHHSTSC